ncbi:MAG: exosortase/archaeosortase family protein [Pseudomonadota bacterium]
MPSLFHPASRIGLESIPPRTIFIFLMAGISVAFFPTLLGLVKAWFGASSSAAANPPPMPNTGGFLPTSVSYVYAAFALPLSAWLICQRGGLPARLNGTRRVPILLLALGLAFLALGWRSDLDAAAQLGLIVMMVGAFGFAFGGSSLHRHGSALAIACLAVPIQNGAFPILTALTGNATLGLLATTGLDHTVTDGLIRTSYGTFLISDACSGLRFILATTMIAQAIAVLSFRKLSTQIVFTLSVIGIAFYLNAIRIVLVIVLATQEGPGAPIATDHGSIGLMLFAFEGIFLVLTARTIAKMRRPGLPVKVGDLAKATPNPTPQFV